MPTAERRAINNTRMASTLPSRVFGDPVATPDKAARFKSAFRYLVALGDATGRGSPGLQELDIYLAVALCAPYADKVILDSPDALLLDEVSAGAKPKTNVVELHPKSSEISLACKGFRVVELRGFEPLTP